MKARFGWLRFSLSTRIILGMAAMVLLTAFASVMIFNIIINNQARDAEASFQKIQSQLQELRKQTPVVPQAQLDQIKEVVNNPNLPADTQLSKVRNLIYGDGLSPRQVGQILRGAGVPVSLKEFNREVGAGPNALRIGGNRPGFEAPGEPPVPNEVNPVLLSFVFGSLIAALVAVALGFVLSRTLIKPLRRLEQASERIADGNYTLEVGPEGKDDLGRLARSFNKMARALRQTEQKRKDLVADVAHELRTPLSSIQGYTEVLRDGLITSPTRQLEIHEHILKEVRHLTSMVESLRVWMSNEQALDHLNVEDIPASLPAQMVLDRFQPTAERKEVSLELEVAKGANQTDPLVRTDSDALGHVLSNLVDNALRYTPAGGTIRLRVLAPARLPDSTQRVVRYEVQDSGRGIPAEHLPFVFERFYRVDKSRDRNTGGTGLGLAIVRDTIQTLGGDVQITSEVGQGTTVSFWLPAVVEKSNRKPLPMLVGSKAS